jgi:hypothetical protein
MQSAKEMWRSPEARKLKKALTRCKRLCLATCVIRRSLKDYLDLFKRLSKG